MSNSKKLMMRALAGEILDTPPVWLMRQAGRYLPEYRELRANAKNFLQFCYTPDLTVEVALQPLRRFPLDAAILFSDILVIPDALGQEVGFFEGEGPRLEPSRDVSALAALSVERTVDHLAPVYESLSRLRAALDDHITLIGFAGARVIEETIREKLPEGFQRAEYLLEHGMLDRVVHRLDLRDELVRITRLLMDRYPSAEIVPIKDAKAAAAAKLPKETAADPATPLIEERPAAE